MSEKMNGGISNNLPMQQVKSPKKIFDKELSDADLESSVKLYMNFLNAFPAWDDIDDWALQSQIIEGLCAFIIWRKAGACLPFNFHQYFDIENMTDMACDVRMFLIRQKMYPDNRT